MKATNLFCFALLVINFTYGTAQNTSQVFDHYWLVQVWPHGYCLERDCARRSDIFILHGLWPVTSEGKTLEGDKINKTTHNKILKLLKRDKSLEGDLMKYWLSLTTVNENYIAGFWIHEWEKHGSARKGMDPLDYFRRAVELAKTTDLRSTLAEKGVLPNGASYPKFNYMKAIMAKTGHLPMLRCVKKGGHNHLKEVIICVGLQAKNFRSCNYGVDSRRCKGEYINPHWGEVKLSRPLDIHLNSF